MKSLHNRKLLFGVTGGIAVYKAAEIIRGLVKMGVEVYVTMTKHAQQFVTPLTFETLSSHPVMTEMFPANEMVATRHIDVPRDADAVLICPATANFIGKMANGIADDLLTTMVTVAGPDKTILCPAMNTEMWDNPLVQKNVALLREYGSKIVDPGHGELACHTIGVGRLASVGRILSAARIELLWSNDFSGLNFLITAGPTEEPMDPVRYITNSSSGKMGFALAEAALSRGANVTLITGPTALTPPDDAETIFVRTAAEMEEAVLQAYSSAHVVIMSAAVSDYRPADYSSSKLKKEGDSISLILKKNNDILAKLGKEKKDRLLVGFAVETDNVIANASLKLREKNLDMIVVNNPNEEGAAFRSDTNRVTILSRDGEEKDLSLLDKFDVALQIMDEIAVLKGLKPASFKTTIEV